MLPFCILGLLPLPLGLAMSHIFVISSYQWGLPTLFLFPAFYHIVPVQTSRSVQYISIQHGIFTLSVYFIPYSLSIRRILP